MKAQKIFDSGQAMVEFAFVITVIVIILMGIIDMGRLIYTTSALSNAVREGARVAVVKTDNNAINNAVISTGVGLDIQTNQISTALCLAPDCSTTTTDRSLASAVRVRITNYPFTAVTPFVGRIFGPADTINLSSSASMTIEVK